MKQTVRSFSIGLFAAGLIMLIVYYFFDEPSIDLTKIETNELIDHLEENGYRIVTEEEYISISVADTNNKKSEEDKKKDEGNSDSELTEEDAVSDDETDIETKIIAIEPGMATSAQVSALLADKDIIDDADEFNQYLLEHGYSFLIKAGVYEFGKDMSFEEIAEILIK